MHVCDCNDGVDILSPQGNVMLRLRQMYMGNGERDSSSVSVNTSTVP